MSTEMNFFSSDPCLAIASFFTVQTKAEKRL